MCRMRIKTVSSKLIYETPNGRVEIEIPEHDLTFTSVVDMLIRPAFLAAGFSEQTIDDHIPRE